MRNSKFSGCSKNQSVDIRNLPRFVFCGFKKTALTTLELLLVASTRVPGSLQYTHTHSRVTLTNELLRGVLTPIRENTGRRASAVMVFFEV
jgi:hypothetical protein